MPVPSGTVGGRLYFPRARISLRVVRNRVHPQAALRFHAIDNGTGEWNDPSWEQGTNGNTIDRGRCGAAAGDDDKRMQEAAEPDRKMGYHRKDAGKRGTAKRHSRSQAGGRSTHGHGAQPWREIPGEGQSE